MAQDTKTGLRAVLLAFLLVGSVVAGVAPVSAAAASVSGNATATFTEDGGSGTLSADVTADSNGISGETLEMRVVDPSDGSVVYSNSQVIDVAANNTGTFTFNVSAGDVPDDGTYDVQYEVIESGISTTQTGALTVTATESVTFGQSSYTMSNTTNTTRINATVEAGSAWSNQSVNLTVIDSSDGSVVKQMTLTELSLSKGQEATIPFDLTRSGLPDSGTYTVEVSTGTATSATSLNVESVTLSGGSGGGDSGGSNPLPSNPAVYVGALVVLGIAALLFSQD